MYIHQLLYLLIYNIDITLNMRFCASAGVHVFLGEGEYWYKWEHDMYVWNLAGFKYCCHIKMGRHNTVVKIHSTDKLHAWMASPSWQCLLIMWQWPIPIRSMCAYCVKTLKYESNDLNIWENMTLVNNNFLFQISCILDKNFI